MGHNWQTGETITAALLNGVAQVADIGTPGTATGDALKAAIAALSGKSTTAMPGLRGIPVLHPSPPAVTPGPGGEASAISGSVLLAPDEPNAITFFGAAPRRGPTYPNYLGVEADLTYTGTTSASPWAAEFVLNTADATGRFEIAQKGNAQGIRVLIKSPTTGAWQYVTTGATFTPGSDGSWYNHLVTLGAAGVYTIRLEFDAGVMFFGLRVGPTDAVSGTAALGKRVLIVGDSFTEPTIVDTGTHFAWDGWAQLMSYVTGYDIWSAASGGTGYVATAGGSRQKFRDRLATDVIPYAPDEVWWAGGINDNGTASASVVAEARACWAQIKAALPSCTQRVLAPFWRDGSTTMPASLINIDAGLAAAAAQDGYSYLPVFIAPPPTPIVTTLTAAAGAGSSQVRVRGAWPAYVVTYVMVGVGTAGAEVRRVSNASDVGDGTTLLDLAGGLTFTHAAGEDAHRVGGTLLTGTGYQGALAGDGDADRFTGSDGTHPTKAGHRNITNHVWAALRAS